MPGKGKSKGKKKLKKSNNYGGAGQGDMSAPISGAKVALPPVLACQYVILLLGTGVYLIFQGVCPKSVVVFLN